MTDSSDLWDVVVSHRDMLQFILYVLAISQPVLKAHMELRNGHDDLLCFFVTMNCFVVPFLFVSIPFQSELVVGMALILTTMAKQVYTSSLMPLLDKVVVAPATTTRPSPCPSPTTVMETE